MKRVKPTNIARLVCPALLLLSACTQSEVSGEENNTPVPVQINSVTLQADVDTRAVSDLKAGSIGVFSTNPEKQYAVNKEYTCDPSDNYKWKSATPVIVGGTDVKLCACFPYKAGASSTAFDLTAQVYSQAEALSYSAVSAASTVNNYAPTCTFAPMKQAYARLTLTITRATGYTKPCQITNITLKPASGVLHSVRTLNIGSGAYSDKTKMPLLSFSGLGTIESTGISSNSSASAMLLLPPQSLSSSTHVQLTIDGVVHSFALSTGDMSKWEAGKDYQVKVLVNETGVVVGLVSIAEWVDKPIAGGTTSGEAPAPGYVVVGSLKVAKGNLMRTGASGVWYLAPDQGYYTANLSGGDYFSWGSTDPTAQSDSGTTMSGISDGCVAVLGNGWRVPTKADFEIFQNTSAVFGSYKSRRGSTEGIYYDTTLAPSQYNQDDYLFLPAAGYWDITINGSGYCCYWCNDLSGGYPYSFEVTSGFGGISSEFVLKSKKHGRSIRCVAPVTP